MLSATLMALDSLIAEYPSNPTPYSNWVIPGKVLCGAYPMVRDKNESRDHLRSLLAAGVTTFVCLQEQSELNMLPDYKSEVMDLHKELGGEKTCRSIQFVHFPIRDGSILHDVLLNSLISVLEQRVFKNNELLYVHCWGGHGRTGTLVACMLAKYYGLHADLALELTQRLHDTRQDKVISKSPETRVQVSQVRRIVGKYSIARTAPPATAVSAVTPPNSSIGAVPG
ncbi:hypothetical protein K7432_001713 [Basidiobolus ranarum]|uniref:Tyrosine specific protein phosphatases domain-containing protein n=1 Tax=Basidiobolus ranarum TaxID=34480 RepID=A0ABR2W9C7_9FUNG